MAGYGHSNSGACRQRSAAVCRARTDNPEVGNHHAPYTGPASAYGVIAKVIVAYMDKVNAEGGINGRKVNMITYDDGYDPIKVMEATRKLVEEDQVLFTLATSVPTRTRRSSPI